MDSQVVQYEFKLNKLLNKFLEPGYRLGNDIYLNILLSHLSGKNNKEQGEELRGLPLFSNWLENAVSLWETSMNIPSASIAAFTLNLASLISTNEVTFSQLNNNNFYMRFCKVLKLRSNDINPSVKLGYLKMLYSFMNHKAGLDWLVATDNWNDILLYCLENQTIYITREGYAFMYDLLAKFLTLHPTFCELIVKKIIIRLTPDQFNVNGTLRTEIDDLQIQKDLMPTLKLIIFILEKCLLSENKQETDKIPEIFVKRYNLEENLWRLLLIARDQEFVFHISKPLYLINFLSIDVVKTQNKETCVSVFATFCKNFFRLFNSLISKRTSITILKLCHLGHIYWKKLSDFIPKCDKEEPVLFENQLIIFQIMPIIIVAFSIAKQNEITKDELTEMFIHKLFKISCEHTIRCAYSYRALLMSFDSVNLFDIGQKSIFYLMKTRNHFHRDRAVIVFQALMYAMKCLTKALTEKSQLAIDLLTHHTGFLSAMLDGLSMLIKDFKITWTESVESICLTSLTLDFLNVSNMQTKLQVQGLQLMHLTIANFMPPNLALLVDEVSDTSIAAVTPMLNRKLHDNNWEIRDSAFEILYTMVDIAHIKFPAFQKMIIDERLCQLAVVLTTDDTESFVRASAIKCVTAMIKVNSFWFDCLEYEQLPEKMMTILQTENEAIVRCEATKLICEIYEHQFIPVELTTNMFCAMTSAATEDLHWEVKANALNFWEKVIEKEMSHQGMIDGSFPSVTFSKENKKIVMLTEPEIQSRLTKVLLNLSECGCLAVLLDAMRDNCDLQVTKKAVDITQKLTDLLRKHNSLNPSKVENPLRQSCWDTFNLSRSVSRKTDPNLSNNIIDNIVHSSDLQLLDSVYKSDEKTVPVNNNLKNLKVITPEEFKNFINKDLDSLINEKNKWHESLDDLNSLLDDILQSYEENDINTMDCY